MGGAQGCGLPGGDEEDREVPPGREELRGPGRRRHPLQAQRPEECREQEVSVSMRTEGTRAPPIFSGRSAASSRVFGIATFCTSLPRRPCALTELLASLSEFLIRYGWSMWSAGFRAPFRLT